METETLQPADFGSLVAVGLSLVVGVVALGALPNEVAIHWASDGSPNTALPPLPAVLLTPAIALLAFGYLRGGALVPGRRAQLGSTSGFGVVAGVAFLQVALVALNLGLVTNPLLAVMPGVLAILAATYANRASVAGGA